jgi:prepilin peptidase CpaA
MIWMYLGPFMALLVAGGLWDVWKRRIPNPVTAAAALVGLALRGWQDGWAGAALGLGAGFLVIALLWVPWSKGRVGGGDVKLAAAAAMGVGLPRLPGFLVISALAGGIVALVCYFLSTRAARGEMRGNLRLAVLGQPLELPAGAARGTGRLSVPYGVSFVVGAILTLVMKVA